MADNLEVGDVVLCTVDRIVGTVVFVKIPSSRGEIEGSIVMSEIAPGRIRNVRDYVVPKKKIACKVLRISQNGHIDLSLRRVSQKEGKEVKKIAEEEQSYIKILKTITKEKAEGILEKIREWGNVHDFFQEARENPKDLEKMAGKADAEKIMAILREQKKKKAFIKKEIRLSGTGADGLNDIKKVLGGIKNAKIKYIAGGLYSIESEADDIKTLDNEMRKMLEEIEKRAKNSRMNFSIKEK
jgi:translation initiation factor 2 alpha subunit (eIF-2alpha)